jgi:hypothetical protein
LSRPLKGPRAAPDADSIERRSGRRWRIFGGEEGRMLPMVRA